LHELRLKTIFKSFTYSQIDLLIDRLMCGMQEKERQRDKEREREKAKLDRLYALPPQPSLIVYPSPTAKAGRFECAVTSLSVLLDYRPEDNKEHSFEARSLMQNLTHQLTLYTFHPVCAVFSMLGLSFYWTWCCGPGFNIHMLRKMLLAFVSLSVCHELRSL